MGTNKQQMSTLNSMLMQTDDVTDDGAISDASFLALPDSDKLGLFKFLSTQNKQLMDRNQQLMEHVKLIDGRLSEGASVSTASRGTQQKPVRSFLKRDISEETNCLIIGDSHVSYMNLSSFPMDTELQSFSGIRINEMNALFKTYPKKQLNAVVIFVGTNSILNENIDANLHIIEYGKLIETVSQTFCPRAVYACTIPPHRVSDKYNAEIKKFNDLLVHLAATSVTNVECISIGDGVLSTHAKMEVFKKDDNVHLNEEVTSLMVNLLLEKVFKHSNKIPRAKKDPKPPRTYNRGQHQNYRPYPRPRGNYRPYGNSMQYRLPYGGAQPY